MVLSPTQLLTAEDLYERGEDARWYELVRGELREMSPATPGSNRIGLRILRPLSDFVERAELGEVFGFEAGFVIEHTPDTVRAPDVAFVRAERLPAGDGPDGFWSIVPDLVVEVVSPSDRAGDLQEKIEDYLAAGVRLLWIVQPRRKTITVYGADRTWRILHVGDILDGGDVVPGFQLALADLFR